MPMDSITEAHLYRITGKMSNMKYYTYFVFWTNGNLNTVRSSLGYIYKKFIFLVLTYLFNWKLKFQVCLKHLPKKIKFPK
jgi:hypothetical protein